MQNQFGLVSVSNGAEQPAAGISVGDAVLTCSRVAGLEHFTTINAILEQWDDAFPLLQAAANGIAAGKFDAEIQHPETLKFHMPHTPPQVFCTGANYFRHVVEIVVDRFSEKLQAEGKSKAEIRSYAEEMMTERAKTGLPYIFTRIQSSYAGPFDDLVLPAFSTQPDWEAELGVVFKRGGQQISRENAMDHVAGYLIVNDITSRDQIFTADPKDLGSDWLHAKNSPGFFPMGPMIVPAQFIKDPHDLRIRLTLNGDVMQDESTADMIFDIPRQIEVLSTYARIIPGDVLATGSPAGNGTHYNRYLKPGDVMEVSVEGLGMQRTVCVAAN